LIADRLRCESTEHWLGILDAADIWCSEVLDPKHGGAGFQGVRIASTLAEEGSGNSHDALPASMVTILEREARTESGRAAEFGLYAAS
jgi:hypothetical protein